MPVSEITPDVGQLSVEELRREAHDSYLEATAGGTLHYSLWAAMRAGRLLLALKEACKYGEFSEIKEAEGFKPATANRFMRLAESPLLSQCDNSFSLKEVIDAQEWRSMRNILEAHELMKPPTPTKVDEPVSSQEVELVELCRYSSGYLIRVSAGTDDQICAQRVEFAAETKDPVIARKIRDAVYRAFDAVGILPDRSRSKWQAYKAQEGEAAPELAGTPEPDRLAAFEQRVREYGLQEEFADLMSATN